MMVIGGSGTVWETDYAAYAYGFDPPSPAQWSQMEARQDRENRRRHTIEREHIMRSTHWAGEPSRAERVVRGDWRARGYSRWRKS